MRRNRSIAVVGAGAMGAALTGHLVRSGHPTTLLGTKFDDSIVEAMSNGGPHPALGVPLPAGAECRGEQAWDEVLERADVVLLSVSSAGLSDVVEAAASKTPPDSIWAVATKGWDEQTLRAPSEVVADARGGNERLAILAGPALAAEVIAAAPTALMCAAEDQEVAHEVARTLQSSALYVGVTDDVAGAETAAAYKNVIAIAVGMCKGLSERLTESVFVHRFANARAAIFACGLQDTLQLARPRGGRADTILGLAGAGDLYVTCLGGRNGSFGRLLGLGETPQQAQAILATTVEGVTNTKVALLVAARSGVELPTARAVDDVLSQRIAPDAAVEGLLRSAFARS